MMGIIPTLLGQRVNIENKQPMSGLSRPMPLGCTICTGMFGSGVKISGMKTTTDRLLMAVLGKVAETPDTGWIVEVLGTAAPGSAAVRIVAGASRMAGTTSLVFGWHSFP